MSRRGFTLIELLIVMVVIGVLAAFAVLKFGAAKEKTYVASMKADLRNLLVAEDAYYLETYEYTSDVSCAKPAPAGSAAFCASGGNTLGKIKVVKEKAANKKGKGGKEAAWTASVANAHTSTRCAVYVGGVAPAAPATAASPQGTPVCQ